MDGHRVDSCQFISKDNQDKGCYRCGIHRLDGMDVHTEGTYGKKTCSLTRLLSFCILAWSNASLQEKIQKDFPETSQFKNTRDFAQWLSGKKDGGELGVAIIFPWIVENILR